MDLFTVIKKRHSYRGKFLPDTIPENELRKVVQAGIDAPSGCNAQTTSFCIVTDESLIGKMRKVVSKPVMETARQIIVVLSKHKFVYETSAFEKEDYSAAVENMLLAITALGYATVWLDGVLRYEQRAERISEILGIPDEYTVSVLLPVGVPEEERSAAEKKPFEQRAWFNRKN